MITVPVASAANVPRHGVALRAPDRPLAMLADRRGRMLCGLAPVRHGRTVAGSWCRIHDPILLSVGA